jgi:hypothetical protein
MLLAIPMDTSSSIIYKGSDLSAIVFTFAVFLMGIIGWFLVRTLSGIDKNQESLALKLEIHVKENEEFHNDIGKVLTSLKAEHDLIKDSCHNWGNF